MSNIALGTGVTVAIDYTSRDYTSIINDLMAAIPSYQPAWTSTSANDFGIALLELVAFQGDIVNYYIDRVGNESFLGTAQQASSVLNLAYLIDYQPEGAAPASTVMSIVVQANTPGFTLPMGSQFSTATTSTTPALTFELTSTHVVPANATAFPVTIISTVENSVAVPLTVTQGVTISNESDGTSDGSANQTFTLFNTGVIESSVIIYVDEGNGPQPWNSVAYLSDAGSFDASYNLSIDANGVIYVNFGDGNNGRIPNPQGIVTSTYRVGGGAVSNVGANQITVNLADASISGYMGSVTNVASASGGADAESISQIQANAPQSLTAAGRCVSVQDYASVALDCAGVSKASAVAGNGLAVTVYVHPGGGPYLGSALTSLITDPAVGLAQALTNSAGTGYLDTRKMAGTTVTILPPQNAVLSSVGYVQVVITINLQVLPQYLQTVVSQNVTTAVGNLLDFGSMNFGQRITLSAVYAAAYSIVGVDYLNIIEMYRADASPGLADIVCGPSEIPVVTSPDLPTSLVTIAAIAGGL